MHNGAAGDHGMSHTASRSDAVSSTMPAAVPQLRWGFGDRKKASAPYDVWVSCPSVNHVIQDSQYRSISVRNPVRCARTSHSVGLGGVPAQIERSATATSRRENAL